MNHKLRHVKRLFSALLCAVLLVGFVPVGTLSASAANAAGTFGNGVEGSGGASDPYIVDSAEDLRAISELSYSYYVNKNAASKVLSSVFFYKQPILI
jgi:hypothetical protein